MCLRLVFSNQPCIIHAFNLWNSHTHTRPLYFVRLFSLASTHIDGVVFVLNTMYIVRVYFTHAHVHTSLKHFKKHYHRFKQPTHSTCKLFGQNLHILFCTWLDRDVNFACRDFHNFVAMVSLLVVNLMEI